MISARSSPFASVLLAATCAVPLTAGAQTPSYATRTETIHGTIASVQSLNHLLVADDRGYTDDVTLRRGAAVTSDGVRLVPGERVSIEGAASGSTFLATGIATHGQSHAGADWTVTTAATPAYYPSPVYYPTPVYYPAPVYYDAPAYYGFAPFSIGFGFGDYRRFHHHGGFYDRYRPYRGGYRRPYFHGTTVRAFVHVR
jgi:hypothetical protein